MDALKIVLRAVSAIYGSFFEPVDIKRVGVERKSRSTACTHAGAITNLVDRGDAYAKPIFWPRRAALYANLTVQFVRCPVASL